MVQGCEINTVNKLSCLLTANIHELLPLGRCYLWGTGQIKLDDVGFRFGFLIFAPLIKNSLRKPVSCL